jgi:hypothetical protein
MSFDLEIYLHDKQRAAATTGATMLTQEGGPY